MGNAASQPATLSRTDLTEAPADLPAAASDATMTTAPGFGNNRLATGFRSAPVHATLSNGPQLALAVKEHKEPPSTSQVSAHEVIEISDDEDEDEGEASHEDGGMLINIDQPRRQDLPVRMDVDEDEENVAQRVEGKVSRSRSSKDIPQSHTGRQAHTQLQGDLDRYLNAFTPINSLPAKPPVPHRDARPASRLVPRLADLPAEETELQLKYVFFDLDPETADLNQRAVCLSCLQPGHAQKDCPEVVCVHCSARHATRRCPNTQRCTKCREKGHSAESCRSGMKVNTVPCDICGVVGHVEQACRQRFFPANRDLFVEPQKFWVSCSRCASKSHLVGDCHLANQSAAARWSLKSFTPGSIMNLSIGAGTTHMEEVAANRGLRPEGRKIRGRAGLHNAGVPKPTRVADLGNEEDQFLRPPVSKLGVSATGKIAVNTEAVAPIPPPVPRSNTGEVLLPNKNVLTDFVRVLNKLRNRERKSYIKVAYDKQYGSRYL